MSSAMQAVSQQTPAQVSTTQVPSPRSHSIQPTPSPQPSRRSATQQHGENAHLSVNTQQLSNPSQSGSPSAMSASPRDRPLPPSTHASPAGPSTTASPSNSRPRPGMGTPPIPPPRTSSNKSHSASNGSSRERAGNSKRGKRRADETGRDREHRDKDRNREGRERERERERDRPHHHQVVNQSQQSPLQQQQQPPPPPPPPQEEHERRHHHRQRENPEGTTSPGKSRRKVPPSPEGPQRAASTREPREAPPTSAMETRSEGVMGHLSAPTALVNQGSAVINRMVVTDPEEDIDRAKRRQDEARAGHPDASGTSEGDDHRDSDARGKKSRHDYSDTKRKESSFGDYVLGQTIGEGEFGKVKLGWKKDGSVQVAIKLLRRESLGNNPGRLPKIHREISILRDLTHPNIVRLHEMVETDKHIGIILEYASGGELFDYILNHRYLKDNAARRLFAQLVSGVGYLHKKGIVHRDLKLENLLLDRNRNIIITDFGFANTFDPSDELGEEIEYNLTNREYVKRMRLDRPDAKGMRRGDLMQTSCGSPCYAAPELVVSDSLYTGRKVDVWSSGVILYAMLSGYLPFDDDPANPDGDNINLLYKYIVTTPLTFPEYVTPHARDLLRRMLVPDPRKRADLFEVARHSWLSEYAHVVSHVTSNTTNISDIANATVPPEDQDDAPLARSASVRVPPRQRSHTNGTSAGEYDQGQNQALEPEDQSKAQRDAKRRTVQVEYVPPQSQTARGEQTTGEASRPISSHKPSSRTGGGDAPPSRKRDANVYKALPKTPAYHESALYDGPLHTSAPETHRDQGMPNQRSSDIARSLSELTGGALAGTQGTSSYHHHQQQSATRPQTGGSSTNATAAGGKLDSRQPSRGSYSQPVAPAVATTNAQARLAQPKNGKPSISAPMPLQPNQVPTTASMGHPSSQPGTSGGQDSSVRGHKRSSTVTSIGEKLFGRPGSIFGGRKQQQQQPGSPRPGGKRYPPTSMKDPYPADDSRPSRQSTESRRSISDAFRRQTDSQGSSRPRRFSLLPPSFSLRGFSSSSKDTDSQAARAYDSDRPLSKQTTQDDRRLSTAPASVPGGEGEPGRNITTQDPQSQDPRYPMDDTRNYSAQIDRQFATLHSSQTQFADDLQGGFYRTDDRGGQNRQHDSSRAQRHQRQQSSQRQPPQQFEDMLHDNHGSSPPIQQQQQQGGPGQAQTQGQKGAVLQKNNRKFADAFEYERASHHSGSSGAARKVMDFFRRRGKARTGETS